MQSPLGGYFMKKIAATFTLVLLVGLLAACSGSTPEPASFDVHMTEYAYQPSSISVKVGQPVTINLINDGTLAHEITFGRDVVTTDNRPTGFKTDMFESSGVEPTVTAPDGSAVDLHRTEKRVWSSFCRKQAIRPRSALPRIKPWWGNGKWAASSRMASTTRPA